MEIAIIIPTYNERENIEHLVQSVQKQIQIIKNHNIMILVVDDESPDKTAESVKNLQKKYDNLHLITGEKKGLGVAYLRGFNHAINDLNAEIICMMDADLSHPPELISNFIKAIDEGYDFVIGSRYVDGGATPDWKLKRKLISKGANFLVRFVGGAYGIHDCTSGYRAMRTSMVKDIDMTNLKTKGYAFIPTLLYEFLAAGAKVKEIPLVFYDRKYGETKITLSDMTEFFFKILKLRLRSSHR